MVTDNAKAPVTLQPPPPPPAGHASVNLRFLMLPSELVEAPEHPGCVGGVRLQRARLEGEAGKQRAVVADADAEAEELECGLLLSAIGWRSVAASDEVPFDAARAVVPSRGAKVSQCATPPRAAPPRAAPRGVRCFSFLDGLPTYSTRTTTNVKLLL